MPFYPAFFSKTIKPMDALVILIPLLPLLAMAVIGTGLLFGLLQGGKREGFTADMATWMLTLSCLMAMALLGGDLLGKNHGYFSVGQWLGSDSLNVRVNFTTTGFNVGLAALLSLLLALTSRFATSALHRQAGFHRFFAALSLFAAAVLMVVLSANLVGCLAGWILAEVCGYLMVAHRYQQPQATENATRVFITQRLGDAGFVLGISLCYAWTDSVNWAQLQASASELSIGQATGIGLCFALAAFAKAALVPFTPWLARTLDEPAPVSLIMIHLGVFVVVALEAVFMQSPFARAVLGLVGFATVAYCYIIGKTQTTMQGSLLFSALAQVALMFVECAFGLWELASWHLCANLTVCCLQRLTVADAFKPAAQAPALVSVRLYLLSLQQFWLDQIADWALVKPVRGLAQDLSYVDDRIIDRLVGLPSVGVLPLPAGYDGPESGSEPPQATPFAKSSGLAGKLTEWLSALLHWFEERLVLRSPGKQTSTYGRQIGHAVNRFEQVILRPRYLVLFVCITFLVAF
ncbi:proton-conducting transporter transmembrane domain-containing protein [Methylovulum miyakonense]|uniref:proton-conducting transporter transmembrane domain-containing protein n=1 Tax=Methylovulum miyakonense TaxID=645578 RepID=UPI000364BB7F|nr:proton-conducting transporter membrane subunit [Methylovulum miyakonense]